jgi:phosphatidylglycerophosphate synthase
LNVDRGAIMTPAAPALRYTVQDRSILLPHYKRWLVEPFVPLIPARVHPNVVTHAGHLLNLLALVLLVSLERRMPSGWLYVLVALLVHAYLWCDNADGAHARRTNQCSAMGEFLDHGLDLLNATYVIVMTVAAFAAPPFWSVAAAVFVPGAAAVTYWEQAETGVFQLGLLNQVESIFALTLVLVARGLFGPGVFAIAPLGVPLPALVLGLVAAVAIVGVAGSVLRVARHGGRLAPALPMLAFGAALLVATARTKGALDTPLAIAVGAAVFICAGARQLTLRVSGKRPFADHGVLLAALGLGGSAMVSGPVATALAATLTVVFGGLAVASAYEGYRKVARVVTAPPPR